MDLREEAALLRKQHPDWGRYRIAKALTEKLGRPVSPYTVRRYIAAVEPSPSEQNLEVEKWRLKARHYENLYRSLLTETAQKDLIAEALREAAALLPPLPPLRTLQHSAADRESEEEAVLLIGDVQLGQWTKEEEVGGLGSYDLSTFRRQASCLLEKTLRILKLHRRPKRLHVWFLGDIVDGDSIFPGHDRHVEIGAVEQVLLGAQTFAEMLRSLREEGYALSVVGIPGNHGRIGKKGERKAHESFDVLLYRLLEEKCRDLPDVSWHFPPSWFTLQTVQEHVFLLIHGDDIRAWQGIPYYGIDRADARWTKLLAQKGRAHDYLVLGHHHQPGIWDAVGGEKIVNGAWPPGSYFSFKSLQTGTRPSQYLLGVHRDVGITWTYRVFLS